MLDIFAGYHHIQFQGKIMIQTQENDKKSHLRPYLCLLDQNLDCKMFINKISTWTFFQAIIFYNLK